MHASIWWTSLAEIQVTLRNTTSTTATNTQKHYPLLFNFGKPYEVWILIFIKSIYLKTTSNTCYSATGAIMSDNKTQKLLRQLLVESDALTAKLTKFEKGLKFEITEIKKKS